MQLNLPHNYPTRSNVSGARQVCKSTNTVNQRFIQHIGLRMYNLLPISIKERTKNKFKLAVKRLETKNKETFKAKLQNIGGDR